MNGNTKQEIAAILRKMIIDRTNALTDDEMLLLVPISEADMKHSAEINDIVQTYHMSISNYITSC